MLIITNLQDLLNSTSLEKGCAVPVQVNYKKSESITIPQHVMLNNCKLKLNFNETEREDSVLTIGLRLGSLLSGSDTIAYVTGNEKLLSIEKYCSGKASISFVKSFDDAVKIFGKSGKTTPVKTVGKKKTKKTAEKTPMGAAPKVESEPAMVVDEESGKDTSTSPLSGNMNPPVDTKEDSAPEPMAEIWDNEVTEKNAVRQKTVSGDFFGSASDNVKMMLREIDKTMENAYRYIIEAIHESSRPEDVESMLSMVAEKQFVDKWTKNLETYFDQLKNEVNKIKPYKHFDEIYRG